MIAQLLRGSPRLAKRYEFRRRIGVGWEGVTYLVRDRLDGRLKAFKIITNVRRQRAILAQARVLVRLQHPNIIDYYTVDTLQLDGETRYFLLVEYLRGPRLSAIARGIPGMLPSRNLFAMLRVFYQICRGMAYVHDRGILHDDLHTDNIILTGEHARPVPKLFDFWGSRGAGRTDRREFDLRCAGQVLFECLTGTERYRVEPLRRLPPEVAAIIRRTQARTHRYRTFHQILTDLDRLRTWD